MPRTYEMSWEQSKVRWVKMFKGQRYTIACATLGVPGTKDGSYQAANEWWTRKKAELHGDQPTTDPRVAVLEEFIGHPITDQAGLTESLLTLLATGEAQHAKGEPIMTRDQQATVLGEARLKGLEDSVQAFRNPQRAVDGSIGAWASQWRKHQREQVVAEQLSPDRCANNHTCLAHFTSYASASAPVESIDASRVQGFYSFCLSKIATRRSDKKEGWSVAYSRDVFSVAKSFIRWLWEQEAIGLPKNIGSKSFKFGTGSKALTTWTPDEFKLVVTEAPGKLKLGLLLMANCGMTQGDISDLLDTEVDWTIGRIIRQRSKTAGFDNVPTVNYKLWPLTFTLLKKYRSGTERVLLTESGKPYVRKELVDGKLVKADGFASNFVHLKRRLKFDRSLKQLRKLGATLLDGHKEYGRYAVYFLGQSARSVKDRHYTIPSQDLFDQAVTWLGQQLGQV